MEMPLVSIIVPVYNAQSHLSRCLESICGQEYKNLELIVINDGSKDKSLPVCEEFRKKDSRILLVDKANSGVSDTRNLGLKLAGGKYVQFVDSDDYIAPDYTARLVEAAEKTGADLVISPYTMVIPAGASKPEQVLEKIQDDLGVMHVARPPENREYGFLPEGVYDKDTFARRLMDKPASYFYSVLWNKLYRRDILTRHDIRFTSEMRWAEDLVFNMQYIQYAEVFASIPQPGYYYVQNPQSICHTQIKPATLVQNKIQVFHYYKDLYTRLGMYEQVRPQLYKFLIDIAESTYPSGPFKKVIDEAKDRAKSSSDVWLARMADYDAWLDAQETVGSAYNVKNVATAVELILKIFQRNVMQCSEGWVDTTDNKRYVPIETVIGKTKIPAEDAKVIKKALDTMVGSGQLDAKALYSGLTQLCQQYLDSK